MYLHLLTQPIEVNRLLPVEAIMEAILETSKEMRFAINVGNPKPTLEVRNVLPLKSLPTTVTLTMILFIIPANL